MVEKTAQLSLLNQAMLGRDIVSIELHSRLNVLQELANNESVKSMDWERQRASLLPSVDRVGYLDLAVVNMQGQAHYIKEDNIADLSDRDYVIKSLRGMQAVSDVLISRVINKPVVMYSVPIMDANSIVIGALIGRQDGTALNEVTKNVKLGDSGYSYIMNKDGVTISHRDIDMVLNQYNPIVEVEKNPALRSFADTILLSQRESTGSVRYTYEGREVVVGFVPIPDFEWTLFVTIDHKELLSGIGRMMFLIASFGAGFIAAGLIIAYLLGRSISRPITRTMTVLKDIAEGDLTKETVVSSKDEVGDMARYLNFTVDKIKKLVLSIRREADTLSQTGMELASNMTQTAASITEITASVQSIKRQTGKQVDSVKNADISMKQAMERIDALNSLVQRQTECVSRSSSAIEQMLANIHSVTQTLVNNKGTITELANASQQGRDGLTEVSSNIQEIARESAGLMEINGVMENIASQTNLLSMNAAIEAAHAGEAGKGFAVVADEIRKLAESSSEQSKTISGVLKKIKESIDKITKSTEGVLWKFEAISGGVQKVTEQDTNVRAAMEEQGLGSKNILEAMSDLNEITGEVKRGTEAVSGRSREVMKENRILEQIAGEISGGMQEMASGAEQISSAVNRVMEISEENKQQIEQLITEVSRFKVA
jgi:methyl-accepting chemotaxis protein